MEWCLVGLGEEEEDGEVGVTLVTTLNQTQFETEEGRLVSLTTSYRGPSGFTGFRGFTTMYFSDFVLGN